MCFIKANKILVFSIAILFAFSCNEQPEKPKQPIGTDVLIKIDRAHTIGKSLFIENCTVCHKLEQRQCGGPDLLTATDRWPDKKLLREYIKDAESVFKKSEYARKLRDEYNVLPRHQFPELTDDDVDAIINYLKLRRVDILK
ncbi:MAG: cytochrome c [Chitinophagaceae bacterium]|nr:cytochrome c [Chitinophagaceae bacterium]